MSIGTKIFSRLNGRLVGNDRFGNTYFEERRPPKGRRVKRWVLYKGIAEPSKVPPEWNAWLHHTVDAPLAAPDRPWIKEHVPNLSGTPAAYVPTGDERRGGTRRAASGDYEAWTPGA
ncbi:NADH:ubiquinone oxidoreductase subunit NDUFA12 [Roseospira marina]|uniref:NADH:ubiquinone oxidoreductase subunit NDUFA12 n=1 Tax=Roseospira marina TaxID=140057 RepID=A0A5M6IGJ8_9PROT|nr:NADH:ubiquinone oxidoreductase subunit NDUFA12 [Roseospira marina]KAA5607431.1 NADH:ubiquinone oxidoreductase subunit NDUFA12 [Roseospira marina]MBB4312392.1 NADH:ubiquinone oxidoreductase subunit [Roseospira marina]MBB5085592.1 NADH:ubiquinone oxidoreductase subunit [Roseospira marina]